MTPLCLERFYLLYELHDNNNSMFFNRQIIFNNR